MEELQKINIIYEDNHIMIVEKPCNISVCEDDSRDNDLLNMLKNLIKVRDNKPGNVYLGLVHRLDRPVSGVMVFAKTSKAASRLSEQIRDKSFNKIYYAVVLGITPSSGSFRDYMYKDNKRNMSFITKDKNIGKEAILDYERISVIDNCSLVKIKLKTGRSHQIRVQFSSHGYPLIGDMKYNSSSTPGTNIALFAKELSFIHPTKKEKVSFSLDLPNRYPFSLFR